jgi:hypothetical protein
MGYNVNHALIVSSWDFELIDEAHKKAIDIYSSSTDEPWGGTFETLVSPLVHGMTNGEVSFFIAPDGSKEGWSTSDVSDCLRGELIEFLRSKAYEDGSTSLKWVEVQFADEYDDNRILRCSGDWVDKKSATD